MKVVKTALLMVLVAGIFSFAGCGDGENTVIQPTETYEPTEAESANAEREAQEREAENR